MHLLWLLWMILRRKKRIRVGLDRGNKLGLIPPRVTQSRHVPEVGEVLVVLKCLWIDAFLVIIVSPIAARHFRRVVAVVEAC